LAGVVARFSPVKGHRFALAALAQLSERHPRLDLVIAGEDAQLDAASLREEARARGIGARVHWFGRVADVRELLWALDAGVIASTGSEAVCRIAGEYMAAGLPVIATRVGVLPEMVVDGKTGVLVPPDDAGALAGAVARLIENPEEGRLMGCHGRERAVASYSLAVVRDAYRALYGVPPTGGRRGVDAGNAVRASQ
jgi:glycosyltransferase involved in cell wall biosynthesis